MSNKDIPTIEVDIDPVVQSVETFEKLGVSEASFNAFRQNVNGRVQANTDAVGVLNDRIVTAETAVTELTDGLDARYTKEETDGLLGAKVTNEETGWISLTLANGTTGSIQIRKTKGGIVEILVKVLSPPSGGSGSMMARIPEGYRYSVGTSRKIFTSSATYLEVIPSAIYASHFGTNYNDISILYGV